jgi:deoxyribonuclease-1
MRSIVTLCLILLSFSALAQTNRKLPNGHLAYYGEDFYKKKVTKDTLYKILDESHSVVSNGYDTIASSCNGQACYRHTSVGYTQARLIIFGEIHANNDGKGQFVKDVYCGKKFYFKEARDVLNMAREVNTEHTWPQSRFNGNFGKDTQKSDMHHLYPTDSDANNRRANHSFGNVPASEDELNVENCSSSRLSDIHGDVLFNPPTEHKGNVARSLFYFATRYRLSIGLAEEMILKLWNTADPVDAAEIERHEIIATHQKIRNPFVDYPELVSKISDF